MVDTYTLIAIDADGCAKWRELPIEEARIVGRQILARRKGARVWLTSETDGTVLGLDTDPIVHALSLATGSAQVN